MIHKLQWTYWCATNTSGDEWLGHGILHCVFRVYKDGTSYVFNDIAYSSLGHAQAAAQRAYEDGINAAFSGKLPAPWLTNCRECGRIIDTREKAAGGDPFGAQLVDETWVCSEECWNRAKGATHHHKKRGEECVLIGIGRMQAGWVTESGTYGKPVNMREVAIYRSVDDGSLWVRPREEFEDGRFEVLPTFASDAIDSAMASLSDEQKERLLGEGE